MWRCPPQLIGGADTSRLADDASTPLPEGDGEAAVTRVAISLQPDVPCRSPAPRIDGDCLVKTNMNTTPLNLAGPPRSL